MKKRHIALHVLASLGFGGVESQMRIIAENSARSEYEHFFCAIGRGGPVLQELQTIGARSDALRRATAIPSVGAIAALRRHLRAVRPTVVHLHGAEANFHGVIAARLSGVPVVIAEEIGMPQHSRKARAVFRQIYRRCDRVVAISHAVAQRIVSLGEAEREHIEVIHNPFAVQEFSPPMPRGKSLRLGFVGRLEAVKNPLCAVEALALLHERGIDASLVIIGEGSQRALLEARIAALGLNAHVALLGFHPRPFEQLRGCDFYLQPSLTEGFGLAICEAMSAGIPVIASAAGGAPEIIIHGTTGWLLPRPDAQELAEAVERGASLGYETLSEIARRARESVVDRFGAATYLRRLDELYLASA